MVRVITYIAWRYFLPPPNSGRRAGVFLSILGISIGVLAMVTVTAVMNGLQQGYIRTILEVESGHVQIDARDYFSEHEEKNLESIFNIHDVRSVVPNTRKKTMIRSLWGNYSAFQLIGVPLNILHKDQSFKKYLNIISGGVPERGYILLGSKLAHTHSVDIGSMVSVIVLPEGQTEPYELSLEVSGLFESGYYAFDSGLAIMNLDETVELLGSTKSVYYTVKLNNIKNSQKLTQTLKSLGYDARSWEEYNRAFFSTLQLEKYLIMLLLQLIFIVTAINVHQGRRRMILQKDLETTILRVLGISRKALHIIFILQGTFIGVVGTIIGMFFGVLLALHINVILYIVSSVVNTISSLFGIHMYLFFDSSLFYLQRIPVEIMYQDLVCVTVSAIAVTTISGWIAGKASFKIRPLQIL